MKYASPLTRKKSEKFKPLSNNVAYADYETRGLGGEFICGAIVGNSDDKVNYFYSIDDFFKLLFDDNDELNYNEIYFHNAEYDARYIIDYLVENKLEFQVINRVSRVLVLRVGKLSIIDSYALMSDSLKNLSKIFAPEYEKKTLDLENIIFDPNNPIHMEYLQFDVLALKYTYTKARKVIHDLFGVNAKYTASSTALSAWLTTLNTTLYRLSGDKDDFIRKCYHGGFVYVREVELYEDIYVLDVNSMYPSVMRDFAFPTGKSYFVSSFHKDKIGFYFCDVDATNAEFLFIIGYNDGKKITRASGKFKAYVSDVEIKLAKRLGYKIRVIEGIVFDEREYLFTDFVNICEKIRLENGKNALAFIIKLLQNSLYGKFGSKRIREELFYSPVMLEGKTPFIDAMTGIHQGLFVDEKEISENYMLPHLAAYTTALARCRLIESLIIAGFENVVYCDTDSAFVFAEGKDNLSGLIGVEYGKFKIEEHLDYLITLAPKLYFGSKDRAKGFPKKTIAELKKMLYSGETPIAKFEGLNSCRNILKNRKPFQSKMSRRIQPLPPDVLAKLRMRIDDLPRH